MPARLSPPPTPASISTRPVSPTLSISSPENCSTCSRFRTISTHVGTPSAPTQLQNPRSFKKMIGQTATPTEAPPPTKRAFVPSCLGVFSLFASDIKLSHTLFALPFALLSAFLAADGLPKVGQL